MAADAREKGIEAGYDCWAATYDDGDPSTWLDEPFLLNQLKPFPDCRILDVGCGTGRYLRLLNSGLYRITAVDLSRGMLCRARRHTERREEILWVQASVTCLPFQSGLFDRVMSGLVLDHNRKTGTSLRTDRRYPEAKRTSGRDVGTPGHAASHRSRH